MLKQHFILIICILSSVLFLSESKLKETAKSSSSLNLKSTPKTEIYKIYYYDTCAKSSCSKGLYCVQEKCIKSLDGAKGSYCGFWSWIFCGSGLNCVDNICIDKSKQALIKFIKA